MWKKNTDNDLSGGKYWWDPVNNYMFKVNNRTVEKCIKYVQS